MSAKALSVKGAPGPSDEPGSNAFVNRIKALFLVFLCVSSLLGGIFALHNPAAATYDSVLNMYRRTRTMHQTMDPQRLRWMSLLSSEPYPESWSFLSPENPNRQLDSDDGVVSRYHVSNGYFTSTTSTPSDVMYINGESMSILSSFAPNVYLSVLIFIFFLYTLHMIMAPKLDYSFARLSWMPSSKPYVFALIVLYWLIVECNYVIFSNWSDFTWNNVLTVRYNVEGSTASVLYAAVVLCLYAFHLCVKSGDCRDLFGNYHLITTHQDGKEILYSNNNKVSGSVIEQEKVMGNVKSGPVDNDTTLLGSVTLFLLSCGSIGMARSVAPETEAQVVLACALSIAALEYLCAKVCAYFWYVHGHYIHNDHLDRERYHSKTEEFNISQSLLLCRLTVFVQTLVLFVNSVLLYILLYVLVGLRQSTVSPVLWLLIAVSALYVIAKACTILYQWNHFKFAVPKQVDEKESENSFANQYKNWHDGMIKTRHSILQVEEIGMTLVLVAFIFIMWVLIFIPDDWAKGLRNHEKIQYFSLAESTGSVCLKGVQLNSMMTSIAKSTCAEPADKWTLGQDTPIDMKVYEWTRWWRPMPDAIVKNVNGGRETCTNCQSANTFFCASGFEANNGDCAEEYKKGENALVIRPVHATWNAEVLKYYNFTL